MAAPTFFELFGALWAENGTVGDISLPQYKSGWAFIGSIPPTVEQFNLVQQLNDQKLAWLYQQVKSVADAMGQSVGPDTIDILLHALQNLDMDRAAAGTLAVSRGGTGFSSVAENQFLVGGDEGKYAHKTADEARAILAAPKICSITALPSSNIGPIVVAECSEVWIWSASASFTGYRSPLCGRPLDGHTLAPLASEVDAVGGLLPKAAYARLWGYAQENNLVVTQATWAANVGAHYFVDVDANQFRVPDLRNMFRRFTGTDADTANARQFGSWQFDATQRTFGTLDGFNDFSAVSGVFDHSNPVPGEQATAGNGTQYHGLSFDNARVARTSSETRPKNTAFHPRIHA
ncbi:hypothetical protein [Achromobacter arsenitoxydans]|uniref:Uncharacterized protein n=1 Tax=Achromobacter arsenitoxydans SY8 TaxID=477184 RepID=H0F9P6_9BURK|nr:hypothetical protein [Achromobacter arsenitoxydans]EHK65311.1 hypothetical protein KYC_17492 [Achromobacter arsenitoxydans SY8]